MMRPFFVYIFRFIVVFTKIEIVEELREGWQWSSPDFSSGSGNVQPDPTTEPVEVSGGVRPSYQ